MAENKHYALAREAILAALTAYTGITTADGATPVFNTLIDDNLKNKNDFISGKTVLIGSGDALYEDKGAASFDNTDGTITFESAFSAQIKAGTIFRIVNVATGQMAELLDSLVSYRGTATADGAIGGGTLVCSDLTTKPDFNGNQVVIKSGPYAGQVRDINGDTRLLGGTVTPHTSFGGTITEGTRFSITAIRTVPAEVAAIETKLDAQKGATGVFYEQADAGINASVGAAEQFIVTLNAANTRYILRNLRLKSNDPGVGNTITVKLYELINSLEVNVDSFVISQANFATYFSLMDMFGLPHIAGDSIRVSLTGALAGPITVTGQYSHGKTNV